MGADQSSKGQVSPFVHFGLHGLLFCSGAAGLGYEIVWVRIFAVGLGHEMPSLLAVVAAFFGGLAIGAWSLDGLVSRSAVPGRWYAAFEVIIGAWALVTIGLIPWANTQVALLTGVDPGPFRHWLIAFAVPFVALCPATLAMGATLPAMDRLLSRLQSGGRTVAGLYAANTLGAVAGTMVATFLLVPALGHRATLVTFAGLNLLCAAAVLSGPLRKPYESEPEIFVTPDRPRPARLSLTLFATGLLGIAYEVLGVRVMAQVTENTVYSFASALSIYLLGTSIGAAVYQARIRRPAFGSTLTYLLVGLSTTCLGGVFVLWNSRAIYESVSMALGHGMFGSVMGELALAVLVFGLPTCLMGAVFSHLAQAARHERGGVGQALGVNTLGGSFATPIFAVWALPVVGAKWALVIVSLGYLLLIYHFRIRVLLIAALPLGLCLFLPGDLTLIRVPPGGSIVTYREGVMGTVCVVSDSKGHRFLKVNDRFWMGGTSETLASPRMGHIPLLLHPNPKRALFLGLGTGITFAAAAEHKDLQAAEAVELVREVVQVQPYFEEATGNIRNDERLTIRVADARRFVRATTDLFDVIVADLFQPARDGAGSLYTVEHFRSVQLRLARDGLFCQWLPTYQLDEETFRVIVRTFLHVFPEAQVCLANFSAETPILGLIGSSRPLRFDSDWWESRVKEPRLEKVLNKVQLSDVSLLATVQASATQLRESIGPGPINSDNQPVVSFLAPKFIYERTNRPYTTLLWYLDQIRPQPVALAGGQDQAEERFRQRLIDYLEAGETFFRAEIALLEKNKLAAIFGFIRSAQQSHEFRPAYDMAVTLAERLFRAHDIQSANQILSRLVEANPTRYEGFYRLGIVQSALGAFEEAIGHFEQAIRINPDSGDSHHRLGELFRKANRLDAALEHFSEAARLNPNSPLVLNNLAALLITHADHAQRRPVEAIRLAQRAAKLTKHQDAAILNTLAAAYASAGQIDRAVTTAQKALDLAEARKDKNTAHIRRRLDMYRRRLAE